MTTPKKEIEWMEVEFYLKQYIQAFDLRSV